MSGNRIEIAGTEVGIGVRTRIAVPIGRRVSGAEVALPIEVVNGATPGPVLFVCAAIHGDEINGVEIIRRVLRGRLLPHLQGTLIAIPVVNLFGFTSGSRYLPDRRDLNRSFPGSTRGSLASRLAHTFITEVVEKSTHGIDLHTAAVHRSNLPQVRACLDDEPTAELAHTFGVPVLINSNVRDGSLRQAVVERKIPMLLYEGGEALRFDEVAIRAGERGVLSAMRALEMLPQPKKPPPAKEPFIARSSYWVRAPAAGLLRARSRLGARVKSGQTLGKIADPLGTEVTPVVASEPGIVIGRTELPLVNEGDALFHVATFEKLKEATASVSDFHSELELLD